MRKSTPTLVLFITLIYLGLAATNALTLRPWCDEGWFANPAENLLTTGSMPTTVLDPTASWRNVNLQGIDRHTYWVMPLYILTEAAWYRITGFSLLSMRLLSVLWGLIALLSWYVILKQLSGDSGPAPHSALLAAALLAIDFDFLMAAGNGRMDMMTLALESAALAAYLSFREHNFTRAVVISQCLAAAGIFTHPMGLLGVVGLVFVSLYYDWKRIRLVHLALAVLPYLAVAAAWGLYAIQSPADFQAQLLSSASGRFSLFTAPLAALQKEVVLRYLSAYGLAPGEPAASRVKGILFIIYVAGAVAAFGARSIRKHSGLRVLLVLAVWNVIGLALLDSFTIVWYLVHIIPFVIALLAVSVSYLWTSRRLPRAVIAVTLGALAAVQLTVLASRVAKHERSDFLAAAGFLRHRLKDYRLVMASSEFGFPLRFDRRLIDDFRLGYRSGKRPDLIVMDAPRYCLWTGLLRGEDAGNYSYIQRLLGSYRVVYNQGAYRMYQRPDLASIETRATHP
jgi:4-amino-4-deoxy-L-arabinose transferase-like glycosyltransferase